ncbi:MAG: hypothetical protein R3Y04_00015 [Rikenellaceae bacterium]
MNIHHKFILLLISTFIVSCNNENSGEYSIYTLLTEIETTNYESNEISIYELSYCGYNENGEKVPIVIGETNDYGEPILSKINAINGSFSSVEYTYINSKSYLDISIVGNKGSNIEESYKLSRTYMAEYELVGDDYEIMADIRYNDGGYRTEWYGYELSPNDGIYNSAEYGELISVNYHYSLKYNTLQFQQTGIIGAPFYQNITGNFGKQSQYLLSYFELTENGTTTTYAFEYETDYFGNITQEKITRDGENYIRNIYSYSSTLAQ